MLNRIRDVLEMGSPSNMEDVEGGLRLLTPQGETLVEDEKVVNSIFFAQQVCVHVHPSPDFEQNWSVADL